MAQTTPWYLQDPMAYTVYEQGLGERLGRACARVIEAQERVSRTSGLERITWQRRLAVAKISRETARAAYTREAPRPADGASR